MPLFFSWLYPKARILALNELAAKPDLELEHLADACELLIFANERESWEAMKEAEHYATATFASSFVRGLFCAIIFKIY